MSDADRITLLKPYGKLTRATKEYEVTSAGRVIRHDEKMGRHFEAATAIVGDIDQLFQFLASRDQDQSRFVIRAALKDGIKPHGVRRVMAGKEACFEDAPRSWTCADIDKTELAESYSVLADPTAVAEHLVDRLAAVAPDFDDCSAVVQFSSSAGIGEMAEAERAAGMADRWGDLAKTGRVSAHVWFRLTEPRTGAEMKRWGAAVNARCGDNPLLDLKIYQPNQPIYVAAPGFGDGLKDPLAGRRVVLVRRLNDAADITIPAPPAKPAYTPSSGATGGKVGASFEERLAAIGGPKPGSFNDAIGSAVGYYVGRNWPDIDADWLVDVLRERVLAADPSARPQSKIQEYADPANLRSRIEWAMAQEAEKAAAKAKPVATTPTFPDRGVTLAEGQSLLGATLATFKQQLQAGEKPAQMVRLTVGGGKTEQTLAAIPALLQAARQGGGEEAKQKGLWYLVPAHRLGDEIAARFRAIHPGKTIAVWRGQEAEDPNRPGKSMCLDLDLAAEARKASVAASEVCKACPLRNQCGYQRQRKQKADYWAGAHNLAFNQLPSGVPRAAVTIIDEAFSNAGIAGDEKPVELSLETLASDLTGSLLAPHNDELRTLRQRVAGIVLDHSEGRLRRQAFLEGGFTHDDADRWLLLESTSKPIVELDGELSREQLTAALKEAAAKGYSGRRVRLAMILRALLAGTDFSSVNAEVATKDIKGVPTPVIAMAWREDFAKWAVEAPKLLLDATSHPTLVRAWVPDLQVTDIEISAPHQHVRQVTDKEFGRRFFTSNRKNVRRLADLLMHDAVLADGGDVLAVAQLLVKNALVDEFEARMTAGRLGNARFDAGQEALVLPGGARIHFAHHGAVAGIDKWRNVTRAVIVGRLALNRPAGERLAEIIAGRALGLVVNTEDDNWPTQAGGIRMADGTGLGVTHPHHPDPLVEAVRWSISEGSVLQAIGRPRGVQRDEARPVTVTVLGAAPLPLTVVEVTTWGNVVPDRLGAAMAEAALTGRALPLCADWLADAGWWPTAKAAEVFLRAKEGGLRANSEKTLIDIYNYKRFFRDGPLICVYYREENQRLSWKTALVSARQTPSEQRAALEAAVGMPVAAFATDRPPEAEPDADIWQILETRLGGVTPLAADWLAANHGDLFGSERTAKRAVAGLGGKVQVHNARPATFRLDGQRRPSRCLVAANLTEAEARAELERLMGKPVTAFTLAPDARQSLAQPAQNAAAAAMAADPLDAVQDAQDALAAVPAPPEQEDIMTEPEAPPAVAATEPAVPPWRQPQPPRPPAPAWTAAAEARWAVLQWARSQPRSLEGARSGR